MKFSTGWLVYSVYSIMEEGVVVGVSIVHLCNGIPSSHEKS